jgi:hypothetical protein
LCGRRHTDVDVAHRRVRCRVSRGINGLVRRLPRAVVVSIRGISVWIDVEPWRVILVIVVGGARACVVPLVESAARTIPPDRSGG